VATTALELSYTGAVQGVGFRPHAFRIALRHGVAGWVRNEAGGVAIHVEGAESAVTRFVSDLEALTPGSLPPNRIRHRQSVPLGLDEFVIRPSRSEGALKITVPLDSDWCADCAQEFNDPGDRRHRYPFINCTRCGPRYTIIERLPYDRSHTTMGAFPLCADCATEYRDPADRRFHAEPVACPTCGPRIWFDNETAANPESSLASAVRAVLDGQIVAVKGVGGYHLLCDATNATAVERLRRRKRRPARPFAVLFPEEGADDLDAIRAAVRLTSEAATSLRSPARPIVLLPKRDTGIVTETVAPDVPDLGVFLPPSPLHRALIAAIGRPVVATSGNISGEPLEYDPATATRRLAEVTDHFLHHNRPIARPVDDGVQRVIAGQPRWLRVARGTAPRRWSLPLPVEEPTIALGGHLKSTVTLAWGEQAVTSPHLGDLDTSRARVGFADTINTLQSLYGINATRWVGDAHPDYASRRWASRAGHEVEPVWHHHAHASALAFEANHWEHLLVFTWDGVGLGPGGQLWGGETFYGGPGHWERVAHFKPFHPIGGDRVGREPWRSAAALCWETQTPWLPLLKLDPDKLGARAWVHGGHRQTTTAAGRLFDAAAALILDCHHTSYEAEGGLRLEALAGDVDASGPTFTLERNAARCWEIDWFPWVGFLLDTSRSTEQRASAFHTGLARGIADVVARVSQERRVDLVGLTGGVFQNRVLTEQTLERVTSSGMRAFLPTANPCNDGGLSLGQLIEVAYR
jgi:hydrogenase maturation protein HypF